MANPHDLPQHLSSLLLKVDDKKFLFYYIKLILGVSCVYALAAWGIASGLARKTFPVKTLIRVLVYSTIGGVLTPIVLQAVIGYDDPVYINTITLTVMGLFTLWAIISDYPRKKETEIHLKKSKHACFSLLQ
jgi:hypothetical protein